MMNEPSKPKQFGFKSGLFFYLEKCSRQQRLMNKDKGRNVEVNSKNL
ncbi:hypothetical protein ABIE66_003167 [Peribacillus sp. B2I2]